MGRVRVFYGHEGVVLPTGSKSRSAAPAVDEEVEEVEVDEIVADDPNGEPVEIVGEPVEEGEIVTPAVVEMADGSEVELDENGGPILQPIVEDEEVEEDEADAPLPNGDWTVGEIEEWAKTNGVDLAGHTKSKKTRLAHIAEHLTKGE